MLPVAHHSLGLHLPLRNLDTEGQERQVAQVGRLISASRSPSLAQPQRATTRRIMRRRLPALLCRDSSAKSARAPKEAKPGAEVGRAPAAATKAILRTSRQRGGPGAHRCRSRAAHLLGRGKQHRVILKSKATQGEAGFREVMVVTLGFGSRAALLVGRFMRWRAQVLQSDRISITPSGPKRLHFSRPSAGQASGSNCKARCPAASCERGVGLDSKIRHVNLRLAKSRRPPAAPSLAPQPKKPTAAQSRRQRQ